MFAFYRYILNMMLCGYIILFIIIIINIVLFDFLPHFILAS